MTETSFLKNVFIFFQTISKQFCAVKKNQNNYRRGKVKHELRVLILELRVQIYELRVQIHELED